MNEHKLYRYTRYEFTFEIEFINLEFLAGYKSIISIRVFTLVLKFISSVNPGQESISTIFLNSI